LEKKNEQTFIEHMK